LPTALHLASEEKDEKINKGQRAMAHHHR